MSLSVDCSASAAGLTRRSLLSRSAVVAAGFCAGIPAAVASSVDSADVSYHTVEADGVQVFYREAGSPDAPTLLLLHGFANSSHYFRQLMPRLADRFHLIAPDIPSFGFTVVSASRNYKYSFASMSNTIKAFVDALHLKKYALYVFDYGGPIGFNLALSYPDRVTAIITQNGNAYEEGLGKEAWLPVRALWKDPTEANRNAMRSRLTLEGVRDAYLHGAPSPMAVAPEAYWLDAALLARPGNDDIQIDLKYDYRFNVAHYPLYQEYFRKYKPTTLAIWGKYDPFFIPPGAEAFRRDIPEAKVRLLEAGHFALETHVDEIASAIREMPIKS
jgi:pimeloyl-ACP methyl ester carboxylesterase